MRLSIFILTIIIAVLSSSVHLNGQRGTYNYQGSKSNGLAGISTTLNSTDAIFNNLSNLALGTEKLGGILSAQQRWSLSELNYAQIGVFKQIDQNNTFAIGINSYGFSEYREHKVSLSYARKILDNLALSVNFDFNQLVIAENGQTSFFTFGLGLSGKITEKVGYGAYIFNFQNSTIALESESSAYLQFGIYDQLSDKLRLHSEVEKYVDEAVNVKVGLEYIPTDLIGFRIGYNSSPGSLAFGASLDMTNTLSLDIDAQYNNILGISPSLSINYIVN